ncbi:hypothetical protein J7K44_02625 [bacterium]|nr:hypothetical protein [bacterium]
MSFRFKLKILFLISVIGIVFLFLPFFVSADYLQQENTFFIEASYDSNQREQISATLQVISSRLYFYVDNEWWEQLNYKEKDKIKKALYELGQEFDSTIYPTLTSIFGKEWTPGIDRDKRITVLIHPMEEGVGGYFNNADEYSKLQISSSNEREMIYLNANYISDALAKSCLAHEFVHLITFNQKERAFKVTEDVWLNEARAEAAISLLGYNDKYEGSNLQRRVRSFLEKPHNSLTEWQNTPYDYGVLNLFIHYLIDHYGVEILVDSLHSSKVGISSIDYALKKNGFDVDFSQIFTDWTIAVLINDCSIGEKYCYKNQNLKEFKVIPFTNFLPFVGKSTLRITDTIKNWSGNWYRITGGRNNLKVEFTGSQDTNFTLPYVVQNIEGEVFVDFLTLDKNQKVTLYVPNFGSENTSLTIIPSVQIKTASSGNSELNFTFSWEASTVEEISTTSSSLVKIFNPEAEEENEKEENEKAENVDETREELLQKIKELQEEIRKIKIMIIKLLLQKINKIQEQIAEFQSQK